MSESEKWILGCTIVMALGTIGALIVAIIAVNKKQEVRVDQPVNVTITEELHKTFAAKEDLKSHVAETKDEFRRVARERSDDLRLAAQSRRTMYEKQDATRKELTERSDAVRKDLGEKIDSIPDQVIATLRNAGAIGGKND